MVNTDTRTQSAVDRIKAEALCPSRRLVNLVLKIAPTSEGAKCTQARC
jgi:hypothetical protein